MKELPEDHQDLLIALLTQARYDRAFVSLALWASEPAGPDEALQLFRWRINDQAWHGERPGPDDFEAADLPRWRQVPALHLLRTLDIRLFGDWQTAHRTVQRLTGALPDQQAWLMRRHGPARTRSTRLVGLRRELSHFDVIPTRLAVSATGPRLELHSLDELLDQRLHDARHRLTGFIGHFPHGVNIDWQHPMPAYVLGAGLQDASAHRDACTALLAQAAGVSFFVLPECTAPSELRAHLARQIGRMDERAPLLSVPGSFHDAMTGAQPGYRNCCELIDARGCTVFQHAKTEVATSRSADGTSSDEFIAPGTVLHAVATRIGVVGVAICLEFSDPKGTGHAAWSALAPAWMLVPSMGEASTLALHRGVAEQLHQTHRTVTLLANQPAQGGDHPGWVWPAAADESPPVNRHLKLARPALTKVN